VSRIVSEDEVRQVANLARLGLTNDEVKKMGEELGVILESVEQIGELELSDAPPTANPLNCTNVLRSDEPEVPLQRLPREEALSPAPEAADACSPCRGLSEPLPKRREGCIWARGTRGAAHQRPRYAPPHRCPS
jgi:aspartyl-tRNA(Asn)/glutamyl-tRNA(Gln) amidotransferase subunit C